MRCSIVLQKGQEEKRSMLTLKYCLICPHCDFKLYLNKSNPKTCPNCFQGLPIKVNRLPGYLTARIRYYNKKTKENVCQKN